MSFASKYVGPAAYIGSKILKSPEFGFLKKNVTRNNIKRGLRTIASQDYGKLIQQPGTYRQIARGADFLGGVNKNLSRDLSTFNPALGMAYNITAGDRVGDVLGKTSKISRRVGRTLERVKKRGPNLQKGLIIGQSALNTVRDFQ